MLTFETEAKQRGHTVIAGVDEAGRGPLAGPVVAAAVVLPGGLFIEGLTDSKKLTAEARERLYGVIREQAVSVGVGMADAATIDSINILAATKKAMLEAAQSLAPAPDCLLIDGNQTIGWNGWQQAIVKGDSLSLSIAAASVIAKVERDRIMVALSREYSHYGFERHKGYGCETHRRAIAEHGPCPEHRVTFKGVREYAANVDEAWLAPRMKPQLDLLR